MAAAALSNPLVVRIKRKACEPVVETLLLQVCDDDSRPSKRLQSALSSLSLDAAAADSNTRKPESGRATSRLLFHHVASCETVRETTTILTDLLKNEKDEQKQHRSSIKLPSRGKQSDKDAMSTRRKQESARKPRFENILWKSRRVGSFHIFDIQQAEKEKRRRPLPSAEDRKMLASFLPLIQQNLPDLAAEWAQAPSEDDEYVYDVYTMQAEEDDEGIHMHMEEDTDVAIIQVVDPLEEEYDDWEETDSNVYDDTDDNREEDVLNDYYRDYKEDDGSDADSEEVVEDAYEDYYDSEEEEEDSEDEMRRYRFRPDSSVLFELGSRTTTQRRGGYMDSLMIISPSVCF